MQDAHVRHHGKHIASVSTDNAGEIFTVGHGGITEIRQHNAAGEGDRWFYDVYFENGKIARVFNMAEVIFTDEQPPNADIDF